MSSVTNKQKVLFDSLKKRSLSLTFFRADDVKVILFCGPLLTKVSCGQHSDIPPLLFPKLTSGIH